MDTFDGDEVVGDGNEVIGDGNEVIGGEVVDDAYRVAHYNNVPSDECIDAYFNARFPPAESLFHRAFYKDHRPMFAVYWLVAPTYLDTHCMSAHQQWLIDAHRWALTGLRNLDALFDYLHAHQYFSTYLGWRIRYLPLLTATSHYNHVLFTLQMIKCNGLARTDGRTAFEVFHAALIHINYPELATLIASGLPVTTHPAGCCLD